MPPLEGDPDAPTGPPDDEDREVEEEQTETIIHMKGNTTINNSNSQIVADFSLKTSLISKLQYF